MLKTEKLKLVSEWDKTFPLSEKVDHKKVTFVNRYGITLAADLYKPKNKSGKYPLSAIVCAYNPEHCSLTAPNGPLTAIAGYFPDAFFGLYKSAASVIP